jgi:hypothetical protein
LLVVAKANICGGFEMMMTPTTTAPIYRFYALVQRLEIKKKERSFRLGNLF